MNDIYLERETGNPRRYRRQALFVTAIAIVLVYALWNIREVRGLLYPLNLFVTYIHEASHSAATLISGGEVGGFEVFPDGSGVAYRYGGVGWLVKPAGYLGAALFGSALFYLMNRFPRYVNQIAILIGVGIVAFSVLFARTDGSFLTLAMAIGVISGLGLMWLGAKAPRWATMLVLNVLAVSTALNAVMDVWWLTRNTGASLGAIQNDAASFANEYMPLVPIGTATTIVAFTWALIAVLMLAAAFYYGVWKPLKYEVDASYDALVKR